VRASRRFNTPLPQFVANRSRQGKVLPRVRSIAAPRCSHPEPNMTTTHAFSTAFATRVTAFSLAALVSLALLGGMGRIADRQVSDVVMAQAATAAATQVVVVTGHRVDA
jgi:hypothetical protein